MNYARIGSVSSGTLRTADLLGAFAAELDYQVNRQPRSFKRSNCRKLINAALRADPENEFASELVGELQDALGLFAAPYCYFGAHEGDGADFGYWWSYV